MNANRRLSRREVLVNSARLAGGGALALAAAGAGGIGVFRALPTHAQDSTAAITKNHHSTTDTNITSETSAR